MVTVGLGMLGMAGSPRLFGAGGRGDTGSGGWASGAGSGSAVGGDRGPRQSPSGGEIAATRSPGRTLVRLASISDDDLGEEVSLVWEIEPNREVVPATRLPVVTGTGWDDPQELGAFLDAVRWGTVASADTRTLQAPFRSGITIEEYQLEPVARALALPRVNLLIADDVGLGKTIEAGLVAQEMLLRHRARRIMVVCPAPLTVKWREEMAEKFGMDFTVLSSAALRELRRTHGLLANPFTVFPRTIISLPWLRTPRVQRLLDEVLTPQARQPGFFDLLIVDDAHHCAPPAPRRSGKAVGYAVDSCRRRRCVGWGSMPSTGCSCRRPRTTGTASPGRRCWRSWTRSGSPVAWSPTGPRWIR